MAAVATSLTHFGESAAVRPGIRCFIAADILLPLNGLLIAVFLGWVWHRRDALAACDLHTAAGADSGASACATSCPASSRGAGAQRVGARAHAPAARHAEGEGYLAAS